MSDLDPATTPQSQRTFIDAFYDLDAAVESVKTPDNLPGNTLPGSEQTLKQVIKLGAVAFSGPGEVGTADRLVGFFDATTSAVLATRDYQEAANRVVAEYPEVGRLLKEAEQTPLR